MARIYYQQRQNVPTVDGARLYKMATPTVDINLSQAYNGEEYDSAFEGDSDVERKRKNRIDLAVKEKSISKSKPNKKEYIEEYSRDEGSKQRFHLLGLDAYARHKKFINDYVLYYQGATSLLQRDTSRDRTDTDVIRENHKFLWSDEDKVDDWGKQMAKKYYDKLYKEYCICDITRYKESKIALRWRVEKEVLDGKGQFICGSKACSEKDALRSWEINFAYVEDNEKKNALVKLRLCPECSFKLNYRHQNKEVKPKKRSKHSEEESRNRTKSMKTGESSSQGDATAGVKTEPDSSDKDAASDELESSKLWKGPVQVEDKSRDDEFDQYFDDLFL